jgi:photosystem II stability/assembly factor-like uncharacterized protein
MKKYLPLLLIISLFFFNINYLKAQFFWVERNSGVSTELTSVSNINSINAYVCGVNGIVLKTSNTGLNWINVGVNGIPSNVNLTNIFAYDLSLVFTIGFYGPIYYLFRSSNGGNNWTVSTQLNIPIRSVWMTSASNGFLVGDPAGNRWSLRKTTTGGVSWDSTGLYLPQSGSEMGINNSLWVSGSKIWFGTNNSRIYYSSNSGTNWIVQSSAPVTSVISIWFRDVIPNVGYASGVTGLLKSTNDGLNWQQLSNTIGTGFFNSALGITNMSYVCLYLRSSSNVYFSGDGGNSWFVQYTAPSGTYTHFSHARSGSTMGPGVVYAVRNNGGISSLTAFINGVTLISNEIPSAFMLYQNYPNPFNPVTRIKFNIPRLRSSNSGEVKGALVILKIFDVTGREVFELVNEIIQPGVYSDEWDGTNYPSGIYFYQLSIINPGYENTGVVEYRETKKLVLLK